MNQSWFFKIIKINKSLAKFTKIKEEKSYTNATKNEKEETQQVPLKSTEVKEAILKTPFNKLKNLDEMDTLLHIYDLPKLNQEHIKTLNRPVAVNEINAAINTTNLVKVQELMSLLLLNFTTMSEKV